MTLDAHDLLVAELAQKLDADAVVRTHISSVILMKDRVLKLKKPVDFGFLNYSTLPLRARYCDEEIRLGKMGAPSLYLRRTPIYGSAQAPQLEPLGAPIEYGVLMHRFPASAQLDNLLEADGVTEAIIDTLADRLVDFHAKAPQTDPASAFGTPERVVLPMQENIDHLDRLLEETDLVRVKAIETWTHACHKKLWRLIAKRKAEGYVRECHGDLHLRNMALQAGDILFFDPIEFSKSLRNIDVISDLAFLLMDLQARGRSDYAYRILNRYLDQNGDYEALFLLRFYMVYRAMVRAKVTALQLEQNLSADQKAAVLSESRRYLALADILRTPGPPLLVIMHGLSGSGKSFAAAKLAEKIGAIRLRSDSFRLSRFPDPATRYLPETTRKVYASLAALCGELLPAFPVIVDATFLQASFRARFADLAARAGAGFFILQTEAPDALLIQRLLARKSSPSEISEATPDVLRRQQRAIEPLTSQEERHHFILSTQTEASLDAGLARFADAYLKKPLN